MVGCAVGVYTLDYCGGIVGIKKPGPIAIGALPDFINISSGLFSKDIHISYDLITNIIMQTNEQISKNVTLTRLLLVGVLAFGAKKKTKGVTNCLVISYLCDGLETSAIFSGSNIPKVYTDLLTARQNFFKRNPAINSAPAPTAPESNPAAEIERFHGLLEKGIITPEEFAAKKAQLLGV